MNKNEQSPAKQLLQLKRELADLDAKRVETQKQIAHLEALRESNQETAQTDPAGVTSKSPEASKID